MNAPPDDLIGVLERYGLEDSEISELGAGLINKTYLITNGNGGQFLVQRINPMFESSILEDIDAVTQHLENKGLLTPRLIHTLDDGLFAESHGARWRLYNFIQGRVFEYINKPVIAREAGIVLARFHQALLDLDYDFKHVRYGVHDTQNHMANLRTALETQSAHPRFGQILPLAEAILDCYAKLPTLESVPLRKVHGDPKITNVLFEEKADRALCLIDFDTLSNMALPLELGDAFRSWCNPHGEDTEATDFSLDLFRAGLEGYVAEGKTFLLEEEWRSIVPATNTIFIELAARFCADALNESFFGWNKEQFNSHSEHNEIRARGQFNASRALMKQYKQAEKQVNNIFG
jgi:Ser/Thr protein kinase RdoA (MazF antagonist)